MIVAVDGPAASGKGTLAKRLARRFGFAHLDTGGLYRATALHVPPGADPADPAVAAAAARRVTADDLLRPDLRGEGVAQRASVVAAIPEVRTILLGFQRDFATRPPGGAPGAVLDGRDIGTVVCPDAAAKLFVTATLEARARRRFLELKQRDPAVIYDTVLQDMVDRDARDSQRRTAPLVPAPDAFFIDTTDLDADAVFATAADYVGRKLAGKGL
jgi:cytidylate kinase